jgi:hypothetical protein
MESNIIGVTNYFFKMLKLNFDLTTYDEQETGLGLKPDLYFLAIPTA